MNTPCIARVLIIENDLKTRSQLVEILTRPGYIIQAGEGQGPDLLEDAKRMSVIFRPHVIVMDLRLLDDEYSDDRSGLELLKDRSFASSRCILHSAYLKDDYRVAVEALVGAGVVAVIGKEEHPVRLINEVEKEARSNCICLRKFSIDWPPESNEGTVVKTLLGESTEIPSDAVTDILGHLFPNANEVILSTLKGAEKSSASVFRGRSVLFQVTTDHKVPFVLKFAPRIRIEKEINAYKENIEDRLGGQFYAHLLDYKLFWELGGSCYRFIGFEQETIKPFTIFYQEHETSADILRPLQHFFELVWSRHFSDSPERLNDNLFSSYDAFLKLDRRLSEAADHEEMIVMDGLPGRFINPIRWILEHREESLIPTAAQAITHGDLHGDNLFVDEGHAWAIDFERSGLGPILRDFVELEVDIVTRLLILPTGDRQSFKDLAVLLCKPETPTTYLSRVEDKNEEILKCLDVVQGLRSMAHKMTGYQDMREYYWGLLFDTLFSVFSSEKGTEKWGRGLVFASILCERLSHWNDEWPIAELLPGNTDL